MGISTLLHFLVGGRSAIGAVAAHPRAWVIGLAFVLSAGFAREYDNEDLLHDPWYLLIPLAASLGSSFLLFCVLYGPRARRAASEPSFFLAYRAFLSAFWFTAPLAWLYAIPYERFLDAAAAAEANVNTLALVSVWRVALMARVAVVVMGMRPLAATARVLAFALGVALLALFFLPFPVIEVMGGVHVAGADQVVRGAAMFVGCFGTPLFALCFALALSVQARPRWQVPLDDLVQQPAISRPLKALAFVSLAIWIAVLPVTQPEQQLRRRVDMAFGEGRLADALELMSVHVADDFPPHWEPPPRFLKGEDPSLVIDVWQEILKNKPATWVRDRYLAKIEQRLRSNHGDQQRMAELLNHLPEGPDMLRELVRDPRWHWCLQRLIQTSQLRPELERIAQGH